MRPDKDYRPDVEVKREMFEELSKSFDIRYAIDDNPPIVDLWKSLNLEVEVMPRVDWEETLTSSSDSI